MISYHTVIQVRVVEQAMRQPGWTAAERDALQQRQRELLEELGRSSSAVVVWKLEDLACVQVRPCTLYSVC